MEDNKRHSLIYPGRSWSNLSLSEVLFCLSLLSIFFPVKVYPLFLIISSLLFYRELTQMPVQRWLIFLGIFSVYATTSFLFFYNGEMSMITNLVKLLINFVFLYFAVSWLQSRDNTNLLRMVDLTLALICIGTVGRVPSGDGFQVIVWKFLLRTGKFTL
jgi:hypothetical protein